MKQERTTARMQERTKAMQTLETHKKNKTDRTNKRVNRWMTDRTTNNHEKHNYIARERQKDRKKERKNRHTYRQDRQRQRTEEQTTNSWNKSNNT